MIPWRLYVTIAVCAAAIGFGFYVRHLQSEVVTQKARAEAAQAQAGNNAEAVRQVDHYEHTTTIVREKADAAAQTVQSAAGASEAVPDGVLNAWRTSIDGMRQPRPAPANPGS